MTNVFRGTDRRLSRAARILVLGLCCAGAVGGLGCATYLATSAPNHRAADYFGKPVLTDSIYAVAKPDAALARKIGNEGAIAFLGKQHTYLLVEGGTQLSDVARQLDGSRLTLEGMNQQLFCKDKALWGNVSLRYVPGQDEAQRAADQGKLETLGFKADKSGVYHLSVVVKGAMFSAAKLRKDLPPGFAKEREIAFYNPPNSSPPPDLGKLITVPLAVVADVALTPVYLLGFVVLVLAN